MPPRCHPIDLEQAFLSLSQEQRDQNSIWWSPGWVIQHPKPNFKSEWRGRAETCHHHPMNQFPSGSSLHWLGKLVDHWGLEGKHRWSCKESTWVDTNLTSSQKESDWCKNWRELSSGWCYRTKHGFHTGDKARADGGDTCAPLGTGSDQPERDWCVPKVITI